MNEKLMAGVIAVILIAPMCSLCVLGPAVVWSLLSGLVGWFGGFDPTVIIGLAMATGAIVIIIAKRRRAPALKDDSDMYKELVS